MELNKCHCQTSAFFAALPQEAAAGAPVYNVRSTTPFGVLVLRFASRSELTEGVITAKVFGTAGIPALGFNVDRKSAAAYHKEFEKRLDKGYCGLLFLGYPWELVADDGITLLGGRPPMPVASRQPPARVDEFGFDEAILWKPPQPRQQRQRRLRSLRIQRTALCAGEAMATFRTALLSSDPADDLRAITARLEVPVANLPAGLVLQACAAAALQVLIQSYEANPCAKGGAKGGGGGGAKGRAAAFAKHNKWTEVCQAEYDKSVRFAAKMSDKARAAVSKLLADDGLDAAKQFVAGGKVFNWFNNRTNAFVCESCSQLCSSEANYRKHLCTGKCAGGKKVLFDAGNMLEFTWHGMPGKKEMAKKHPALSKVLEELVLEAKKKKK